VDLVVSVGMVAFGAYAVLFNRSFSQTIVRQQKAVWKVDVGRYEWAIRVVSTIAGIVLLAGGIGGVAEFLFD
jgi:hypothetical protein